MKLKTNRYKNLKALFAWCLNDCVCDYITLTAYLSRLVIPVTKYTNKIIVSLTLGYYMAIKYEYQQ